MARWKQLPRLKLAMAAKMISFPLEKDRKVKKTPNPYLFSIIKHYQPWVHRPVGCRNKLCLIYCICAELNESPSTGTSEKKKGIKKPTSKLFAFFATETTFCITLGLGKVMGLCGVGLGRDTKIRCAPVSNQESKTAAGELGQPDKSWRGGNPKDGNPTQAWLSSNMPSRYKLRKPN